MREIPQIYHRLGLIDPPNKIGNLMVGGESSVKSNKVPLCFWSFIFSVDIQSAKTENTESLRCLDWICLAEPQFWWGVWMSRGISMINEIY